MSADRGVLDNDVDEKGLRRFLNAAHMLWGFAVLWAAQRKCGGGEKNHADVH